MMTLKNAWKVVVIMFLLVLATEGWGQCGINGCNDGVAITQLTNDKNCIGETRDYSITIQRDRYSFEHFYFTVNEANFLYNNTEYSEGTIVEVVPEDKTITCPDEFGNPKDVVVNYKSFTISVTINNSASWNIEAGIFDTKYSNTEVMCNPTITLANPCLVVDVVTECAYLDNPADILIKFGGDNFPCTNTSCYTIEWQKYNFSTGLWEGIEEPTSTIRLGTNPEATYKITYNNSFNKERYRFRVKAAGSTTWYYSDPIHITHVPLNCPSARG